MEATHFVASGNAASRDVLKWQITARRKPSGDLPE